MELYIYLQRQIPLQCGIESVKTAADVYAPVKGEVVAHNENAKSDPSLVNKNSEDEGWILKIKVFDEKELGIFCSLFIFIDDLMNEQDYKKHAENSKDHH